MDIENAKQEFTKFTDKLNKNNPTLIRKIGHSLRVMEASKKIAQSLKLSKEEIEIITLTGLLHDIGKLEQYDIPKEKRIEHGKKAVEILKKDNYIRKYIKENKYDNFIYKAIENHGLFKMQENLKDDEIFYAKILRDADKLDIFYEGAEMFWKKEDELEKIENSIFSKEVLDEFFKNKPIDRQKINTPADGILNFISFIFDINFKYDFIELKEKDYINQILNKFNFKNTETKEQMKKVREIANKYIEKRNEQN